MKKLTADKCRNHIERLRRYESESLYQFPFEIEMLEAFEIALPVLEQQEKGTGDWIEWHGKCGGNDQPVIGMVEVKLRNGNTDKAEASDWYWPQDGIPSDIIAYRVVEQQERERGEE